ncbi:MAG: amino acid permease [Planctomycetes bacterium]|nr:amino acid permease [Planctomycetota bacterium]
MADPPASTSTATGERKLLRSLTLIPAMAIILANIIGTGVFVKARVMTINVGTPSMVLVVWICAGMLTLTGSLVYAELSTMMPRSGGALHYIGAAYGRRWGYLYGWTITLAIGASVAALAILLVTFLNDLLGGGLPPWALRTLPLVFIAVTTALNLASVKSTGHLATALTVVKIALVLGVGIGGFLISDGSWQNYSLDAIGSAGEGVPESARHGVRGFGAAMLGALWSYNGWAVITALGGEVKDPGRTLPRTMIWGTLLVIALYLLINAAYFYVLTPMEIGNLPESKSIANATVQRFGGNTMARLMSAGLVISAYGTLHTTIMVGARLPYALARKGLMPASLGIISARRVPAFAVLATGAWGLVLALSGTFDILTDIYVFVIWIFYGMSCVALFILRRKMPDAERPYRVWGYPIVPAIFLVVTTFLLVNTFLATPGRAISGFVMVVSGLPVYAYYSRRLGSDEATAWLGGE